MNKSLKKFKKGGYNIYTKQKTNTKTAYKSKRSISLKSRTRKNSKNLSRKITTSKSSYQ